jgi:hypothetical protein
MKRQNIMTVLLMLLLLITACQQSNSSSEVENTPLPEATTEEVQAEQAEEQQPTETAVSTPEDPIATPLPVAPEAGTGIVKGRALSLETSKPFTNTYVWLADVYREGGEGAYVLDVARNPHTTTDIESGDFVIPNLKASEYVIIIGDVYGKYAVVTNPETNKPATWLVKENDYLEVGDLNVLLKYAAQQ